MHLGLGLLAAICYFLCSALPALAGPAPRLELRLEPDTSLVHGLAELDMPADSSDGARVWLAPQATVEWARVGGRPVRFERLSDGTVHVGLPEGAPMEGAAAVLELGYTARFADPYPEAPANLDNPGFGVSASVGPQGAFLLGGSGWLPQMAGEPRPLEDDEEPSPLRLTVFGPPGWLAVTSGEAMELDRTQGLSRWRVPAELLETGRLALAAGPFELDEVAAGPLPPPADDPEGTPNLVIPVRTFFHADHAPLAPRYLGSAAQYIKDYAELHGPYAFSGFAVVENFFPTGYGFPAWTLLGSMVLPLPFIPQTSLRHEVAHSWWGNGVLVDLGQGNWCEGLTSYVADYRHAEEQGPGEARIYRQKILEQYASLVAEPGSEPPLSAFVARTDPLSQVIGYGKALFVFHMARQMLGDDDFWQALRGVYAAKLFQPASWSDFRDAFVAWGMDPAVARQFFTQWIEHPGAPRLELRDARSEQLPEGGWRVTGALAQIQPGEPYLVDVPLCLTHARGRDCATVRLLPDSQPAEFSFDVPGRPTDLAADPDCQIFRVLEPDEVPATINALKGAQDLTVVLGGGAQTENYDQALTLLLDGLGQRGAKVVPEAQWAAQSKPSDGAVLLFGKPATPAGRALLAEASAPDSGGAPDMGFPRQVSSRADTLLAVWGSPRAPRGAVLFPDAADPRAVAVATRKTSHYGSYGLLAFAGGSNLFSGRLPAAAASRAGTSPVRVHFTEE